MVPEEPDNAELLMMFRIADRRLLIADPL